MLRSEVEQVIADQHWSCEVKAFLFTVVNCRVQDPDIEAINISYVGSPTTQRAFRVEVIGSLTAEDASRKFDKQPDLSGDGFRIWKLEGGLQLGYFDLGNAAMLWLEQPDLVKRWTHK